ncbi:MAG: HAD hydrolase-like protein [Sulfolobales archaeon]
MGLARDLMELGAKALFIDLDMTLVDTARGLIIAMDMVRGEFPLEIQMDSDTRAVMKSYYNGSLIKINEPMKRWIFWRYVWIKYLENRIYGIPMPCSEDFLRESAGRMITAIVTGREVETRLFVDELNSYGFPLDMISVYSTGDLGFGVTKRELYEQLARKYERLGIPRSSIVVISDSPRDLLFANETGFKAIGYIPFDDKEVEEMISRASHGLVLRTLCPNHGLFKKPVMGNV